MGRMTLWAGGIAVGLWACSDAGAPSDDGPAAQMTRTDAAPGPDARAATDAARDPAADAALGPDAAGTADAAPGPDVAARPDARVDTPPDAADRDSAAVADAAGPPDAAPDVVAVDARVAPDASPPRAPTAAECFAAEFVRPSPIGPDYDQFGPIVGEHCRGTNHQDIQDVERVVFLGDSVTVGTPPTPAPQFYRSLLAEYLAVRFRLPHPNPLWKEVNLIDGMALVRDDGTFASCARYGARTDDLLRDRNMILDCFPEDQRHRRTLVVITMGGNDISSITQAGIEGQPIEDIWVQVREFVQLMRDAVHWFREPGRFPNGVYVVFGNMFEFTDGTGDVTACPAAGLAGFGAEWEDVDALADMVIWANEQFMQIAVETQTDMVFMLESFCGHGFNAADEEAPCFRGPGTENWFDLTCIHPNPTGHRALADLFSAVVEE